MTDQTSETTPDGLDVAAVRERVEAATEGPWTAESSDGDVWARSNRERICRTSSYGYHLDAEFIAHARTDIPLLLAALDEARREAETHREVAESMTGMWQQEKDRADRLEGMADRLADRRANHEPWHCCCAEGSHAGQAAALNRMRAAQAAAESARDAAEGVVREVRALHHREVARDALIEVEGGRATIREDVDYCAACGSLEDPCPTVAVLDRLAPVTTDATEGEA